MMSGMMGALGNSNGEGGNGAPPDLAGMMSGMMGALGGANDPLSTEMSMAPTEYEK
jgi:hypothetical protein